MGCKTYFNDVGRVSMIVCSRDRSRCHVCGKPATSLCDATKRDGYPCDAPMCEEHRHRVGEDTDVCKYHNRPNFIKQAIENRKERERVKRARDKGL